MTPTADPYGLACLASVAGEAEQAFALLAQALAADAGMAEWARTDPDLAWIRDDPRFEVLLLDAETPAGTAA